MKCPHCGNEMLKMPVWNWQRKLMEYYLCIDCVPYVRIVKHCKWRDPKNIRKPNSLVIERTALWCKKMDAECNVESCPTTGYVFCPQIREWGKEKIERICPRCKHNFIPKRKGVSSEYYILCPKCREYKKRRGEKPEIREKRREHYKKHRKELLEYAKAYRKTHKKESLAYRKSHKKELLAYAKARYLITKKERLKHQMNYRIENPEKSREILSKSYKKHRKNRLEYGKKYYKENPEKVKAKALAQKIPLAKFCELCPENDKRRATRRHHPDYDEPEMFVSVCSGCHGWLHQHPIKIMENKK